MGCCGNKGTIKPSKLGSHIFQDKNGKQFVLLKTAGQ